MHGIHEFFQQARQESDGEIIGRCRRLFSAVLHVDSLLGRGLACGCFRTNDSASRSTSSRGRGIGRHPRTSSSSWHPRNSGRRLARAQRSSPLPKRRWHLWQRSSQQSAPPTLPRQLEEHLSRVGQRGRLLLPKLGAVVVEGAVGPGVGPILDLVSQMAATSLGGKAPNLGAGRWYWCRSLLLGPVLSIHEGSCWTCPERTDPEIGRTSCLLRSHH
mmetsp:Transcript_11228/g.24737  ORF Transcript_11228/g.24737 Transcript_11228/m.24737 type:complete len:216 (+) Transcript_11228:147-794(+)